MKPVSASYAPGRTVRSSRAVRRDADRPAGGADSIRGQIWPLVKATAVGASVAIAALIGVYLLNPPLTGSARGQAYANSLLHLLQPGASCGRGCGAQLVSSSGTHTWRVRLATASWQRCFVLDVNAFGYDQSRGVSGVRAVPCR